MTDAVLYTTIAGVVASIIGIFTWLSRERRDLRADVDRDISESNAEIDNVRRDIEDLDRASRADRESIRKEVGETGHALRTKMHEVEKYVRDEYVHTKTFDLVVGELKSSVDKGIERLEKYFDKSMEKLEKRINGK